MALGPRLEMRQRQGLVITPQLQQAIKLLQLSNVELDAYVETELEKNPLLTREDGPTEPPAETPVEPLAAECDLDAMSDSAASADMDASRDDVSPGERATGDGHDDSAAGPVDGSKASKGGSFEDIDELDGSRAKEKSLAEHLHDQLAVAGLNGAARAIAAVLIDSVDFDRRSTICFR